MVLGAKINKGEIMISKETIALVERVLASDTAVTQQEKNNVIRACHQKLHKPLLSAKQVMELL